MREGARVAPHVRDEDLGAGRGGGRGGGFAHALRRGDGERERFLDQDVLACAKGRDSVFFVELVGGEDKDYVDVGVLEDGRGLRDGERDVEFEGAVVADLEGDMLANVFESDVVLSKSSDEDGVMEKELTSSETSQIATTV